jgi:hypothetical protein
MADEKSELRRLQSEPASYEIVVEGVVSERWADYFGDHDTAVSNEDSNERTTICVHVLDQVALLGHLQRLTDLGYLLLLVRRAAPGPG